MTDYHPATDEGSREVHGDAAAGADPPEAWDSTPLPDPVPSTVAAGQGRAAFSAVPTPVVMDAPYVPVAQNQPQPRLYAHKNEILYAFGGVFFPGLVLLLMGRRKQGIIMLCCFLGFRTPVHRAHRSPAPDRRIHLVGGRVLPRGEETERGARLRLLKRRIRAAPAIRTQERAKREADSVNLYGRC